MRDTKQEVLSFWFDEIEPQQWFQKNDAFDDEVSERFRCSYDMARRDLCAAWTKDADGALALCILLDQFPRNMFRDTPKAFETDDKARLISREAINKGLDKLLSAKARQRSFLFIPFMHSEELEDQEFCVSLFKAIQGDDPMGYEFALKHLDVIKEFGRFPHRNDILGRASTEEEIRYLSKPDSGF